MSVSLSFLFLKLSGALAFQEQWMRKIPKIIKNQLPAPGSLPTHIPTHPTWVLFSSFGIEAQVSWRDEDSVDNSELGICSEDLGFFFNSLKETPRCGTDEGSQSHLRYEAHVNCTLLSAHYEPPEKSPMCWWPWLQLQPESFLSPFPWLAAPTRVDVYPFNQK